MRLNSEQKKAARFTYGIASVLAVPGSGKTFTMTQRIGILVNRGVAPESILGLTFTRNAAEAMRSKLNPVLGTKAKRVHLATIHSFCHKLLREENRQFDLLFGKEQVRFIKKIIKKARLKNLPSAMVIREINLARSNMIDINEFRALYQGDSTMHKIARIMEIYEQEKSKQLMLDFDDLLIKAYELLKNDLAVREKYQNMYSHILVDEFQDTNVIQMAILKLLIEKVKNNEASFWVCGDDWQSIYSFTGASIGNILNFKDHFPDSRQYILDTNYRSTPQILEACKRLIAHNSRRVDKELGTENPEGEDITITQAMNEEDEAERIVNEILELKERHNYRESDMAVLYRANYQSRVIEEAFSRHKIAYHIENGSNFFDRFEVRVLLDYLRVIDSPDSQEGDEALRRTINIPTRYVGNAFMRELEEYSSRRNLSLLNGLCKMPITIPYLKKFIPEFLRIINGLIEDKSKIGPSEMLHILRESLDYDQYISDDEVPGPDDCKIANIDQLQIVANKHSNIASLLNYTDSFASEESSDKNGVRLMTIHKSKGLEFPIVFLIGLCETIMPNRQGDIEEERRIAFVAMSRAMHKLYLSYPQKYMGKNIHKSKFLDEICHPE